MGVSKVWPIFNSDGMLRVPPCAKKGFDNRPGMNMERRKGVPPKEEPSRNDVFFCWFHVNLQGLTPMLPIRTKESGDHGCGGGGGGMWPGHSPGARRFGEKWPKGCGTLRNLQQQLGESVNCPIRGQQGGCVFRF